MTNIRITFDSDLTTGFEDGIVSRVDTAFPVVSTDMAVGSLTVDASSDPDEYSVLMAATEAVEEFGLDHETAVISAEAVE